MGKLNCYQVLLAIGMLITGSINTISKKAQNDCIVPGYPNFTSNGTEVPLPPHEFDHPWFQTIIMFMGESLCLIGLCIHRRRERKALRQEYLERVKASPSFPAEPPQQSRIFSFIFAVPTVCDLIGTSVAGIGLLYVNASIWQMLRGSIIIFAGILSKIFLKRKLRCIHWTGMFVVVIGLILVGLSSVLQDSTLGKQDSKAILGVLLILLSQLVSATQMIVEETFLKKRNFHPLQVVGMEGSFGFVIMAAAVLPAMYFIPGPQVGNSYENSLDALYQIGNSPRLAIFCVLYLLSIAFYNYFGLAVTRSLTAVHRTLIDACRTILVWVVDLLIYYAFDKDFGEEFSTTYGLLQIDGFLFLLIGTALYNELVDVSWLPCFKSSDQELHAVDTENSGDRSIQASNSDNERTPILSDQKTRYD